MYLFRFVVEEYMHTFVAISTPRGEPGIEHMNLVLSSRHTYIVTYIYARAYKLGT